jgi:pyrroloquinoline quinone biosynthesis protein B
MLPSYAGGKKLPDAAVAYVIEQDGRRLVYAPTFLELGARLVHELTRADAVFLDGTCWSDDEMMALGLGTRSAREMGHAPIGGPGGSLEQLRKIKAAHRYYTHVNNSNPILDPLSAPAQELAVAGFAIAGDGAEIHLNDRH